jgi:hypothetical protein
MKTNLRNVRHKTTPDFHFTTLGHGYGQLRREFLELQYEFLHQREFQRREEMFFSPNGRWPKGWQKDMADSQVVFLLIVLLGRTAMVRPLCLILLCCVIVLCGCVFTFGCWS